MNVLVLGGSGFIGSHICDDLTSRGHKVTVNAVGVCWGKVLEAFKVISPVEAQDINELALHEDQW